MSTLFEVLVHPHGVLTSVELPENDPDYFVPQLLEDERKYAATLTVARRRTWAGGRVALRQALGWLGSNGSIAADDRGAPVVPPGHSGSISHKHRVAVALAAKTAHERLGVDIEELLLPRLRIAEKILRPAELEALAQLPENARLERVVASFSVKEAIYKALDPFVRRYVGFKEAELTFDFEVPEASFVEVGATLHLSRAEGPFRVLATCGRFGGYLVSTARIGR